MLQRRRIMNTTLMKAIIASIHIFFIALVGIAWAQEEKGPLRVRNQFAPHLMFLTPIPESPRTLSRGTLGGSLALDYSSVFFWESSKEWNALVDMEMAVIDFDLQYGLTDYLTMGLRVPLVSMPDGFLDAPLETFHNAFGFPNYDKHKRPKNEFAYALEKDDRAFFESCSGGLHLGETTLSAKVKLMDKTAHRPLLASLSYQVKLPTGNPDHGFGSGAVDQGVSLATQLSLTPWYLYITPGFYLISNPADSDAPGHVAASDMVSLFVGGEYVHSKALSLLVQLNFYTSPLEHTGIRKLDDGSLELSLGLIYRFNDALGLELAFSEDLTRAAPDFNLHGRISYSLY
jgi:hypothetical protein